MYNFDPPFCTTGLYIEIPVLYIQKPVLYNKCTSFYGEKRSKCQKFSNLFEFLFDEFSLGFFWFSPAALLTMPLVH